MLSQLISSPIEALVFLLGVIFAITVHEYAHARAAVSFGDDTPRLMGRLTLDPLAHIDPLGGLMFILVGFGWGRPVVYNPLRLKRKVDELMIALAGPAMNLIWALIIRGVVIGLSYTGVNHGFGSQLLGYLNLVADVNVLLAAFNLLPIPPLDGSSIIAYFYPPWRSVFGGQIGIFLLLILILPIFGSGNLLGTILNPLINLFTYLTLGGLIR